MRGVRWLEQSAGGAVSDLSTPRRLPSSDPLFTFSSCQRCLHSCVYITQLQAGTNADAPNTSSVPPHGVRTPRAPPGPLVETLYRRNKQLRATLALVLLARMAARRSNGGLYICYYCGRRPSPAPPVKLRNMVDLSTSRSACGFKPCTRTAHAVSPRSSRMRTAATYLAAKMGLAGRTCGPRAQHRSCARDPSKTARVVIPADPLV